MALELHDSECRNRRARKKPLTAPGKSTPQERELIGTHQRDKTGLDRSNTWRCGMPTTPPAKNPMKSVQTRPP